MLPLIIILAVATAFCCAAPTEQLTPIEPSRRSEPQPAFDTSDEIDLLPIREDGGYEALNHYSPDYSAAIQERDNGDIASALSGAYSHIVRLGGLYQWTFGYPNNNFNISIDTCLKRSNVIGVWQSRDGTTNDAATVGDIMTDLGMGSGRSIPYDQYAARLLQNAQSMLTEIDTLLTTDVLCPNPTATELENHAELRHLLAPVPAGMITAIVVAAAYGTSVWYFYNIIALFVTNPVGHMLLTGTGNMAILLGAGMITLLGTTGDFAPVEAALMGSVWVARMRQLLLQATRAGRTQEPCLPVAQVGAAAVQAAANAIAPAVAGTVQAVANANPPQGAGAADGVSLVRSGSCPNFPNPVKRWID